MLITRTAWTDDDGSGTTGTILNNAEKTALYVQIDAAIKHSTCSVYNNAVQSIGSASHTALTFNAEEWDADALHSTGANTSRITIPTGGAGVWWVHLNAMWAPNATGQRIARFYKNGAAVGPVAYVVGAATYEMAHNLVGLITVADADYLEAFVYQNSGGNLDIGAAGAPNAASARLQAARVS